MLHRILLALDSIEARATAQQPAHRPARRIAGQITGMAILDRPYIAAPTAVGIGGTACREHRDQVEPKQAKALLAGLEGTFEQSCEAEGEPSKRIAMRPGRHDLPVIGKDTDDHLDQHPTTSATVEHLLEENPRPPLGCPQSAPASGPIATADDGSLRTSRAAPARAEAGALGASMVAIDASGHTALQSWLLGTAGKEPRNACPYPVVHH